jgi:hypothetical protein
LHFNTGSLALMSRNTLRLVFVLICFVVAGNLFAQGYYNDKKKDKKYFVAMSYGVGSARWFSHFDDAPLYNVDGSILRTGDLKMQATNPMFSYNFSVCAPVGSVRLGMGVTFEKFSMDKLSIISEDSAAVNIPNSYVLFTENFWFNEIYGLIQAPFNFCKGKPYELDFVGNIGFYGYDGVKHLNFFGDDQIAKTYLANAGFLFDYEVVDHTNVFIYPEIEYKYFHNNLNESPSTIVHNIFTFILQFGIRADVSKF